MIYSDLKTLTRKLSDRPHTFLVMCLRIGKHAMRVFRSTILLLPSITLQLPSLGVLFYHSLSQIYLLIFLYIRLESDRQECLCKVRTFKTRRVNILFLPCYCQRVYSLSTCSPSSKSIVISICIHIKLIQMEITVQNVLSFRKKQTSS